MKKYTVRDLLSILYDYPVYSEIIIKENKLIIIEEDGTINKILF